MGTNVYLKYGLMNRYNRNYRRWVATSGYDGLYKRTKQTSQKNSSITEDRVNTDNTVALLNA